MDYSNYLYYVKEADAWTQCLPIGNGTLGAMIYGGVTKEVLALNHDELWTGHPAKHVVDSPQETLKKGIRPGRQIHRRAETLRKEISR